MKERLLVAQLLLLPVLGHAPSVLSPTLAATGAATFTSAISAPEADKICKANLQAGSDLGAKINACETIIGAGTPGEIWISGGGTMTTQITPSSNHTYRFFSGTYNFPTSFQFVSLTGFKIICEQGCTLNNQQTGYTQRGNAFLSPLLYVNSGSHIQHPVLTANGNVGATSITVASGTGLAALQEVQVFDTRFSEVNQIASTYTPGSTTVPLVRPLENNYTTARGAELDTFNWAKNFLVRGVVCTGVEGATNSSGGCVVMDNALDGTIDNLTCFSSAGRCYLAAHSSSRIIANGIRAFNRSDNSIENYITTSHNIVQNCIATHSTANGIAVHGFHETVSNCHSYGNEGWGIQVDTGQFIDIGGVTVVDGNTLGGIRVSGAATPNTTEATDVNIVGVTVKDNLGDGLSACTGGNSKVNVTGGDFLRNQGAHGNIYLNGCVGGTQITAITNYGATNNGIVLDSTMSGIKVNAVNFSPPPNQAANGVNDLRVAATGNVSQSQFVGIQYSLSATPFLNLGTFSLGSIKYLTNRGSHLPSKH